MGFIRLLINIYIWVIFADVILSYIPNLQYHPARQFVKKLSDITCLPIRKFLPGNLPFDVSPLVVVLLLKLFEALF